MKKLEDLDISLVRGDRLLDDGSIKAFGRVKDKLIFLRR